MIRSGDINIHELGIEPSGRILFANTLYTCLATLSPTCMRAQAALEAEIHFAARA